MKTAFGATLAMLMASPLMIAPALSDEEHPYLDRGHTFMFGGTRLEADAAIRATADGYPEQSLGLDRLGLDQDYNSWYLEYRYSFLDNWELVAAAQTFNSTGGGSVASTFNFNGVEFPAGIDVDTEFDVDTYFVDILYKVYRSSSAEISLGLGVHAFDFQTSVKSRIDINDQSRNTEASNRELLAPLPNLRFQAFYAVNERVSVSAIGGWMSANLDQWSGDFLYIHPRASYRFTDHFGAALGFQYTDVDVTHSRERLETQFDIEFTGPTLNLIYQL